MNWHDATDANRTKGYILRIFPICWSWLELDNGPQVYNTIFCTCVCLKASTIKKKVWMHHELMEKGMEENPSLCSLCLGHGHQNIGILREYWYFDLLVKMTVVQSCLTLCNPMAYTVHGILQARILEWVAVSFSKGSSQPRDQTQVSHIAVKFFTSWATRSHQKYEFSILPIPGPELL